MNIYQKIAKVMEEVQYVQKTGYNAFHKYKYAKEADYIASLRPALLKHGLVIIPTTRSVTKDGTISSVEVEFTIVDTAKPEDRVVAVITGTGEDKGDKGVYKAYTGAKKYFFALTFLIETGDDPEEDSIAPQQKTEQPKEVAAPPAAPQTAQQEQPKKVGQFKPGRPVTKPVEPKVESDEMELV